MAQMFTGVVQRGTKRAAELGFPTINIPLDEDISGVFAAEVLIDARRYPAAAFADRTRKLLEAHVLDQRFDMYGKKVSIVLLKKIRESAVFADDDALREAIADDVEKVRSYFSKNA